MPITAERVMAIIDTAFECYKGVNRLREMTRKIHDDMEKLISRRDIPSDVLDKLQIIHSMSSVGYQFEIPSTFVENLFDERAKFKYNERKNQYARDRMRLLRQGITENRTIETSETRKMKFKPRAKRNGGINPVALAIAEDDDIQHLIIQGRRFHPDRGRCDGIPCWICEELGTGEFAKKEEGKNQEEKAETTNDDEITNDCDSSGQAPDGLEDSDPLGEN